MSKLVFVSYRSTDREKVSKLRHDIEELGHNVWFDKELTGGQTWWDQILQRIRESDYVIVALSPAVVSSQACTYEREYARALGKVILPVLVEDGVVMSHFEPELGQIQAVDYRTSSQQTAFALARALMQLPDSPPLPDPLPPPPPVPASYLNTLAVDVTKKDLSFSEQVQIIAEIRRNIHEFDHPDDVIPLLEKFSRRPDLAVQVVEDAKQILADFRKERVEMSEELSFRDLFEEEVPHPSYAASGGSYSYRQGGNEQLSYQGTGNSYPGAKPKNTYEDNDKWSPTVYWVIVAATCIIPLVGWIAGAIPYLTNKSDEHKVQGRNVALVGVASVIFWLACNNSMMYY